MSRAGFYRRVLTKVVLASAVGLYVFSFGLSSGSGFLGVVQYVMFAIAALAACGFLWWKLRQAKQEEALTAKAMANLEATAGLSEEQMMACLFKPGVELASVIPRLPPPFRVASDEKGISLAPLGWVRVLNVKGVRSLTRVTVKDGRVKSRRTIPS